MPGKFHGQRSMVGYSPCGHKELNKTEKTYTHTHTHTHTHYHISASSSKLIYNFHTPAYFVDLHKLILKLMEVKEPRVAQNSIFKGWTPGLWGILETLMGVRERGWSKRSELFS